MRKFYFKLIDCIAVISAFLYPYVFTRALRYSKNRFISKRASLRLKSCGKNFFIMHPFFLSNGKYITVGDNFSSGPGLRLSSFDRALGETFAPSIEIGDNVCFNHNCHVGGIHKIRIGNNVLVGSNVLITDHLHGDASEEGLRISPIVRPLRHKGEVRIGDHVWIGENVSIMPGVSIGANSIVGANSVVTKSFPPFSIIGGIPAKLIKKQD